MKFTSKFNEQVTLQLENLRLEPVPAQEKVYEGKIKGGLWCVTIRVGRIPLSAAWT